ncbi:hypothetical protein MalM25_15340 [Planctomycetes bacterium MalM25]|nr:hypothetical protein MalM25_15340 [Planctomycetes bacterium MalM25]
MEHGGPLCRLAFNTNPGEGDEFRGRQITSQLRRRLHKAAASPTIAPLLDGCPSRGKKKFRETRAIALESRQRG